MTLREYIDAHGHGTIMRLVREAGVAASTIYDHLHGKPIRSYPTAERIAAATGGAVTITDLCATPPVVPASPSAPTPEPEAE